MSKESAQGFALRQRRGAIGDWLFGAFGIAVVLVMVAGLASASGSASALEGADEQVAASSPVEVVSRHTALQCGDVPPPVPSQRAARTC